MQKHLRAYQKSQIHNSRRGDLLIALYDGAIQYATTAQKAIVEKDFEKKGMAISSTLAIVQELSANLVDKDAPDLCEQLRAMYQYMTDKLQYANIKMSPEPIDEVIKHLSDLRTTWSEAIKQARSQGQQV